MFDHCSKRYYWSVKWYPEPPLIWCFHQTRDLEHFANSCKIPWTPPTIYCPDLIATVPQTSPLSLYALRSQESRLFPICVAFDVQ